MGEISRSEISQFLAKKSDGFPRRKNRRNFRDFYVIFVKNLRYGADFSQPRKLQVSQFFAAKTMRMRMVLAANFSQNFAIAKNLHAHYYYLCLSFFFLFLFRGRHLTAS